MNVSSLEFNFTDFELLHSYNALPNRSRGFNFTETDHSRNKSHMKITAITVNA